MTKVTPKSAELDLLVINQVAGPLMLDLLEELELNGIRSALVTGYMENPHGGKMRFRVISAPELKKAPQWKRLWTWGKFSLRAALAAIRYRRVPMLVVTNPPLTMLLMPWLKRLFGCRYAILQYDIYPDVLVKMGYVGQNSAIARLWRKLSRKAMLQSEAVFTLGNRMAETLQRHFQPGDRSNIVVIPNWADTEFVKPLSKSENPFARKHCLTNKFVVMYSGAFGATHNIESIVQAARRLADDKTVHVVLIGGGTRQAEVEELVRKHPTDNLALLPFQPFEELKHTFPTADCAIVCLDEGYAGLSVPSKTYYALAAGAAILAVAPEDSELRDMVSEERCGIWVPPGCPDKLAAAVRMLRDDPEKLRRMKTQARKAAEEQYSKSVCTRTYLKQLQHWLLDVGHGKKGTG